MTNKDLRGAHNLPSRIDPVAGLELTQATKGKLLWVPNVFTSPVQFMSSLLFLVLSCLMSFSTLSLQNPNSRRPVRERRLVDCSLQATAVEVKNQYLGYSLLWYRRHGEKNADRTSLTYTELLKQNNHSKS